MVIVEYTLYRPRPVLEIREEDCCGAQDRIHGLGTQGGPSA